MIWLAKNWLFAIVEVEFYSCLEKGMLVACDKPSGISSFDVVKIIRTHFQDKV